MKKLYLFLLVLLLWVPTASAVIDEYITTTDGKSVDGGFTLPTIHSHEFEYDMFDDGDHRFIIEYRLSALVAMGTAGSRTFAVFLDGVEVPNCQFMYRSVNTGVFGDPFLFIISLTGCETEWEEGNTGPHTHTVSITQVSTTGNPANALMWNSNIIVHAQEVNTMSNFEIATGLSATEFGFMIGAFVLLWLVRFITNDLFMEVLMAILAWFLGFVWLVLYNTTLVPLQLLFGILVFFTGFYWLCRTIWEKIYKRGKLI